MAVVYFNQSVSFPSLPKKKTFIEVSKFTKTCKQGVIFLDCKEWITFSFSPLKSHYVISTYTKSLYLPRNINFIPGVGSMITCLYYTFFISEISYDTFLQQACCL